MIADISTDLSDPPLFAESLVTGLRPEQQAAAYPDVTGRRYPVAGEFLLALIERQIREFGWRLIERGGVTGGSGEMLVEAEVTTPIAGFKDRIVVRVTDEGDTAYVDMRSKIQLRRI